MILRILIPAILMTALIVGNMYFSYLIMNSYNKYIECEDYIGLVLNIFLNIIFYVIAILFFASGI